MNPRYVLQKPFIFKDKELIIWESKQKRQVTSKEERLRLTSDISSVIFKCLKIMVQVYTVLRAWKHNSKLYIQVWQAKVAGYFSIFIFFLLNTENTDFELDNCHQLKDYISHSHVIKFYLVKYTQKCCVPLQRNLLKGGGLSFLTPSFILLPEIWIRWLALKHS